MAKTPPNTLTPKDRLYIEDLLNVSMAYYKKSCFYETVASDNETRKKLGEFSKMLAMHYDELLNLFSTELRKGVITNG